MKRILIATLFGVVAGGICSLITFRGGIAVMSATTLVWILLNRTVMGFAIGVSGLKLHWAWNGVIVGVVVGSIFSYFTYMSWGAGKLALLTPIGNAVFGLMIEFFTTKVFKAPALAASQQAKHVHAPA